MSKNDKAFLRSLEWKKIINLCDSVNFIEIAFQDLAAVNRSRTPWIVVTSHRPIYTTQMCELGDYVVSRFMREALDSLFEKYQVNLALVAHTHAYERTCLIKGGQCVENGGTQHITIGRALHKESVNSVQRCVLPVSSSVNLLLPQQQIHRKGNRQNAPLCSVESLQECYQLHPLTLTHSIESGCN